jgi:hypothetical protein
LAGVASFRASSSGSRGLGYLDDHRGSRRASTRCGIFSTARSSFFGGVIENDNVAFFKNSSAAGEIYDLNARFLADVGTESGTAQRMLV